jgi:hypothetical protein
LLNASSILAFQTQTVAAGTGADILIGVGMENLAAADPVRHPRQRLTKHHI